jgi:hypothetical protein
MIRGIMPSLLAALAALSGLLSPAMAQHENDLHFGIADGRLAVCQPPSFEVPKVMYFVSGAYIRDQGVDFFVPLGSSTYQLSSVTWRQVEISAGLVGGSRFGSGNPGYLDLNANGPHLHLPFVAASPGTYSFTFRLENGIDRYGAPVPDSGLLKMIWVAGSNYARVDFATLRNLPDTPYGAPGNGFAGVDIDGLVVSAVFASGFYAQTEGRTGGVFVETGESVSAGDRVRVKGWLSTHGAERWIQAVEVTSTEGPEPAPVFVKTRDVGGASSGRHTPGTKDGIGVSTTGLLVRVAGVIRYDMWGSAYICDGSGAPDDGSGIPGVRISQEMLSQPIELPADGSWAAITGISGTEVVGESDVLPVIRPRSGTDVTSY